MLTCQVCGEAVQRQRYRYPVLCSSLCRNRVYRLRRTVRRLVRELDEARAKLQEWGIQA